MDIKMKTIKEIYSLFQLWFHSPAATYRGVGVLYCKLHFELWQLRGVIFLPDLSCVRNLQLGRKEKKFLLWITIWQTLAEANPVIFRPGPFCPLDKAGGWVIAQTFDSLHHWVPGCIYLFIFTRVDDYLDFDGKNNAIALPENHWPSQSNC